MFPGNRPASVTANPEADFTTHPPKKPFPGSRSNASADPQRDGDTQARKKTDLPFGLPFGTAVTHLPENVSTAQTDNAGFGGEHGEGGSTGDGSSHQGSFDPDHVAGISTPGKPTGVSATAGATQATVSWTAPTKTGHSAITSYLVTPRTASARLTPVTATAGSTSKVVTGLTTGTAYTFTVAAVNAAGTGAESSASTAVTPT